MKRISSAARWMILGGVALAGALVCVGGVLWMQSRGYEVREGVDWLLTYVRQLGPVAFFTLMTILPGVGAPMSIFTLAAGPLFSPTLGLPLVLAITAVSIAINLVLTYVLSRWLLRPWLERLCRWLEFKVPEVEKADQRALVTLVRVTPGTPYVLQSYLLGLAKIPFGVYFVISWIFSTLYSCAFIVFGNELVHGKGRGVLIALSLLIALAVGVRFVRRKLAKRAPEVAEITESELADEAGR